MIMITWYVHVVWIISVYTVAMIKSKLLSKHLLNCMCKYTASLSPSELIYGYFIALPQYHIYILFSWYRSGYSCHFHADGHHLLTANTAHHLPVSGQRKSQVYFSITYLWHCAIWYQCWNEEQCGIWSGDHFRTCHLWECASMNKIDAIVVMMTECSCTNHIHHF